MPDDLGNVTAVRLWQSICLYAWKAGSRNFSPILFTALFDQFRHQAGPPGLVTGADPAHGVSVEVNGRARLNDKTAKRNP